MNKSFVLFLKNVIEPFEKFFKQILQKAKNNFKTFQITGGFNFNILDHVKCSNVHNFLNLLHENGMKPTINKPARLTRKTTTVTDHIFSSQSLTLKLLFLKLTYQTIFQYVLEYFQLRNSMKLSTLPYKRGQLQMILLNILSKHFIPIVHEGEGGVILPSPPQSDFFNNFFSLKLRT